MPDSNISSVKTFRHEMPEQPPLPPLPLDRRNITRPVIAALTLVLVILLGINFFTSSQARILSGKGSVRGLVVDEHGQPVSANVIIFGTQLAAKTGQDGVFQLNGVPAGSQEVVVSYHISAVEIPVTVLPGQDIDVGQVQFKVTAAP